MAAWDITGRRPEVRPQACHDLSTQHAATARWGTSVEGYGAAGRATQQSTTWRFTMASLRAIWKPDMIPGCFLNLKCFASVQGKGRNNASGGWAAHLCRQCANGSEIAHILSCLPLFEVYTWSKIARGLKPPTCALDTNNILNLKRACWNAPSVQKLWLLLEHSGPEFLTLIHSLEQKFSWVFAIIVRK